MTDSRIQQPRKRSFLAGCLSHLIFTVVVILLMVGGGYVYLQNYEILQGLQKDFIQLIISTYNTFAIEKNE